ncbi:MAG: 50S ribosomal protein L10 [Mycoplasmataceae bacterium]|nr:50S ribosomal protein L10 [Mycoplasmataceae bacterium]
MAITRQLKEQHVLELKDLISKSNIIIVWDYLGLNAIDISDIRTIIRNEQAINKVYKNRIAKIAFEESGKKEILDILIGPSSFLFIETDDSKALLELYKFIKENDDLSFKAGYINGEFYNAKAIQEIAGLPSKDDLLSMLLSALQGTLRNLAYSVSKIAESSVEKK